MGDIITWQSILISVINFLLVYAILQKFLFGRIGEAVENRRKQIIEVNKKEDELNNALENARQKTDELLAEANQKANQIIKDHQEEAEKIAAQKKKETAEVLVKMEETAKKKIENEKAEMIVEIKQETADLAISATEKIIQAKLDPKEDKKLITNYLNQLSK